jgi:MoaA/NifB/PqqE/SkfB family radical SAM enzyme
MEFSSETGNAGSATLMLHLLGRCNLTCRHCYMDGGPTREERLPVDLVIRAVSECPHLGIGALYVTGGEPLLYREIEEILRVAASMRLQLTVCTNGTLLTERHAAMLSEARARVNISVDGDDAFHDYFRNSSGAFRTTERGIRTAVQAGVPLTVISSISQGNLHLLPFLAEWAARNRASQFRVQPLLKLGRGMEILDQCLTNDQMSQLLLQFSDLANSYRASGMACSLVGVSRQFLLAHPCGAYVCNGAGCHRRVAKEIKKLVVREDGTVLPEITNLNHKFALGRIEDGTLTELVTRYFEDGYDRFDYLCRKTYQEVVATWKSAVVPWDQIVADRSHLWGARPAQGVVRGVAVPNCGTCASPEGAERTPLVSSQDKPSAPALQSHL